MKSLVFYSRTYHKTEGIGFMSDVSVMMFGVHYRTWWSEHLLSENMNDRNPKEPCLTPLSLSLWARLSPVVKWKVINNSGSAHLPSLLLNLFCFHITANWLSQNGRWCMRERGREHLLANVYHLCFLPDHIRHASVMLKTTWRGRREKTNMDYCYSMQIWQ